MDTAEFSFLLSDRVQKIQQIYFNWNLEQKSYIAYSGGKDSVVLSKLIDYALPQNNIPRVYINTGLEYNLNLKFVKEQMIKDNRIQMVIPKLSVTKMLDTYGYPFKSKEHSKKLRLLKQGSVAPSVRRYWRLTDNYDERYAVPLLLQYQAKESLPFPVSEKCCEYLKKEPQRLWAKAHNRPIGIIGIRQDEGGHRRNIKSCLTYRHSKLSTFSPLLVLNNDFMNIFIAKMNVKLSPIYNAPYSFERTGCKGCPFARDLEHNLAVLKEYFPSEWVQCQHIFGKVYNEYARLNYRLSKGDLT